MGCSSSAPAAASQPQPSPRNASNEKEPFSPKPRLRSPENSDRHIKSKADDSPDVRTSPPIRAVKVLTLQDDNAVAEGRLKFRTEEQQPGQAPAKFDKKAQPRKALLKNSSYVGSQLLALAKAHPALQPVAFLLGAVTSRALSAKMLKLDCARIAKVLQQVEGALVKLGSDANIKIGNLLDLQQVLDGAHEMLKVLCRPKKIGVVDPEVVAISSNNAMSALRDKLLACIEMLNGTTHVADTEIQEMANGSFKESHALEQVVISCEGDLNKVEQKLDDKPISTEPDSLLNDECVQICLDAPDSPALFDGVPFPKDATTPNALHDAIMHAEVAQMVHMTDAADGHMTLSDFLKKWPLGNTEAERMAVVQKHRLVEKATEVDVADLTEQMFTTFKAAYVGIYVVGWQSNHLMHCRAAGALVGMAPDSVVEQRARIQARKFSLCQHTIASTEVLVHIPVQSVPSCFEGSMFADPLLCAADEGVAHQAQRLGNPGSDAALDEFVTLVKKGGELMAAGMDIQHAGVSIRIEGQPVGTLCVLHPSTTWNDTSAELLVKMAETVAERLVQG